MVGWTNTARYKWAEITGREIKFRPATFYLGIADWIAGEVEGIPKDGDESGRKGKVGDGVKVSDGVAGDEAEDSPGSSDPVSPGEVIFDAELEGSPTGETCSKPASTHGDRNTQSPEPATELSSPYVHSLPKPKKP